MTRMMMVAAVVAVAGCAGPEPRHPGPPPEPTLAVQQCAENPPPQAREILGGCPGGLPRERWRLGGGEPFNCESRRRTVIEMTRQCIRERRRFEPAYLAWEQQVREYDAWLTRAAVRAAGAAAATAPGTPLNPIYVRPMR